MTHRRLLALVLLAAPAPAAAGAAALAEDDAGRLAFVGRVLDPDERPVEGAVVFADNGQPYQTCAGPEEPDWRIWAPDPLAAADVGPFTVCAARTTDAEGRFEVEGVAPPAEGWALAVHPDLLAARKDVDPEGVRGRTVDVGNLRLVRDVTQRVTVRDAAGKAVEGAFVVAALAAARAPDGAYVDPAAPGEVRVARTDATGRAALRGLRERRYRFAAFDATHPPAVAEADVRATRSADVLVTVLPGATLRVEVALRGTGAPVEGARVQVRRDEPEGRLGFGGPGPVGEGRTDAGGVARFQGLPADAPGFVVTVVPPDWAADKFGTVALVRAATIRGKGDFRDVVTDDDGRFVFDAVAPGEHVLVSGAASVSFDVVEGATLDRDLVR